jgi:hypothetical protein
MFGIQLDFDAEGDPPVVYIADHGGRGTCYAEVFEEPALKGRLWSWNREDWEAGPMTKQILQFMNSKEFVTTS